MGLWTRLTGAPVELIEWSEPSPPETLVVRFDRAGRVLRGGAELVVRPGQVAVLVAGGEAADAFPPGTYKLTPDAAPLLAGRRRLRSGSTIDADVYFISTRHWPEVRWEIRNSVAARDPVHGPVRVRASGAYEFTVADPVTFLRTLLATDPEFERYDAGTEFRNLVVTAVGQALAHSRLPLAGPDGGDTFRALAGQLVAELRKAGIALTRFTVDAITATANGKTVFDLRPTDWVIEGTATGAPAANAAGFDGATPVHPLLDDLPYPQIPASGPVSGRIPLSDVLAPAVFPTHGSIPTSGPPSGRLVLPADLPGPPSGMITVAAGPASGSGPPPVPSRVAFHVERGGQAAGPFNLVTLAAMIREGEIGRDTLVWKDGMPYWAVAESVPEFQELFALQPPPLPPK